VALATLISFAENVTKVRVSWESRPVFTSASARVPAQAHHQPSRARRLGVVALTIVALAVATPAAAHAAAGTTGTTGAAPSPSYPSDTAKPNLTAALNGYLKFWKPNGKNNLHGKVLNKKVAARDDQLAVWINRNASKAQQFKALQDSTYQNADGTAYDESVTVATGLGSIIGPLYVKGRNSGALKKTSALINSSNGTSGAFLGTSEAKAAYSHPRPYLPSNANAAAVAGDDAACAPSKINGSSLKANRVGKSYASAKGNLKIVRVKPQNDATHKFSSKDVYLSAGYGSTGLCTGGSFPSGHGTSAYQAGITLATLLPELAPEILARTSEQGNNRIVLGVHYPLDVVGGRIAGEAAIAARWSDKSYRTKVLLPARAELLSYLKKGCKTTLAKCIAKQKTYTSSPYGGKKMPGGTAQVVKNRKTAVAVYKERLTYGFGITGKKKLAASVPAGAGNLLLTTFPKLTAAQRTSILAQTQIASGYPLDTSGTKVKSWERLNLAAAMSATVKLSKGKVKVTSTGGKAKVVKG
jgi:membrane-associated phospholipid phosphatase